MEVVSGDNWTIEAISRAKLQSNHHHQQTNIQFFYRLYALPVAQPTVSKHWKEKYHIPWNCLPQAHLGSSNFFWPLIAPDYLGGGLTCLSSALWCQYHVLYMGQTALVTHSRVKQNRPSGDSRRPNFHEDGVKFSHMRQTPSHSTSTALRFNTYSTCWDHIFTLRASFGTVYCNRSCLWVGVFVYGWVCYHDNS